MKLLREPSSGTPLGATYQEGEGTNFLVWAAKHTELSLHLVDSNRTVKMVPKERGYFEIFLPEVAPGTRYFFEFKDGSRYPDPASRQQSESVHGPSVVIDPRFEWSDEGWTGLAWDDLVFYELHVGTFSPQGTFESAIPYLDRLVELGVTAIELMPVAQFPGQRNWGYDGVFPFAPQDSYGGTEGLKRLVNACHNKGLGVVLDVVYNHLGPEGNYSSLYAPYFQSKYHTPWGEALNFDDSGSDEVRRYFIQNALEWMEDYHIDGLRLDAVHAILDTAPTPFLEQLAKAKQELETQLDRRLLLIAESDSNDSRLVLPQDQNGIGLDMEWSDDFHHAVHVNLTGEHIGYYEDFQGDYKQLKALQHGVVYDGVYSEHRQKTHGRTYLGVNEQQLVVFSQNHDQVGNRMLGERLSCLVDDNELRLAAALTLINPFTPLLFMGEEYGEKAPFLYFISHTDPNLVEAVRKGRQKEFASFKWQGSIPDPQSKQTFENCKLNFDPDSHSDSQKVLFSYYKRLIEISKHIRRYGLLNKRDFILEHGQKLVILRSLTHNFTVLFNLDSEPSSVSLADGVATNMLLNSYAFPGGPSEPDSNQIVVSPRTAIVMGQLER